MFKKIAFLLIPLLACIIALAAIGKSTAADTNLIPNPSVETANAKGTLPVKWVKDKWGRNTTKFIYKSGDAHSGSRSLYVDMTKHTSGDAKWYFRHVSVKPGQKYDYSEFYKASVPTEVDIEYTDTAGKLSYGWLGDIPASSSSWAPIKLSFTAPSNAVSLTVYQLIDKVGWLQTDDFSLTEDNPAAPAAPSITITSPAANSTVSGSQSISADASDNIGVAGVQFKLDGNNIGSEDTTAPYSVSWDTSSIANGAHTLTATARNTSGLSTTASETVDVQNTAPPTAPSVSLTAPGANAVISGSQTVSASAADNIGIKNVQFKLDGADLGAADTTAPYSVDWDTKTAANGKHVLTAVATNTSGLTADSSPVTVDVENYTAPTVKITSPAANTTVSGTVALTADAASAQGVASVQFKLNGANLGSPVTAAPYTMNWDSTKTANGAYSLTATVTDKASLTADSAAVSLTVLNQAATPPPSNNGPNLIANPSLETSSNGTSPDSWLSSNWGTNTSAFTYLNTGHSGSHSVKVQTTSRTNGAANWYYNDIPVNPSSAYEYTNWYQSNVDTEVDAEVVMTDGSVSYYYLGTVLASPSWAKFSTTFTPPAGAKSMAIYQILAKVGYIVSDDYSLNTYTPQPFNRALVSVSFDDGWTNQYQNAFPLLTQYGIPGTFNIISGELTDQPDYMSGAQVKNLDAAGNEIASHTVTHPDLTTLSATKMQQEMSQSQATLQTLLGGKPVTDFAYPFGAYNLSTIAVGKQYYVSQRTVNAGTNTKDNFDLTQLKIHEVDSNISQAQVQGWINSAIAEKSWLILVYHEIAVTPTDPTDDLYDTQPADLNAELAYLKNTGVATVTVSQAINEILPQL